FPPLATLDRVNHVAALVGWIGLTVGVVLALAYSLEYGGMRPEQLAWGVAAWLGVSALALGRVARGWQARRAAIWSSVSFTLVLVLYVVLRVAGPVGGKFH
ncbi:MAG: cytochrome c biogenesis protein CcsA, partial [Gemmatimonadota bacterium]|nr:cytochrome c biogenesis protein CcsA [Gemmatimonadota bacterium]